MADDKVAMSCKQTPPFDWQICISMNNPTFRSRIGIASFLSLQCNAAENKDKTVPFHPNDALFATEVR